MIYNKQLPWLPALLEIVLDMGLVRFNRKMDRITEFTCKNVI